MTRPDSVQAEGVVNSAPSGAPESHGRITGTKACCGGPESESEYVFDLSMNAIGGDVVFSLCGAGSGHTLFFDWWIAGGVASMVEDFGSRNGPDPGRYPRRWESRFTTSRDSQDTFQNAHLEIHACVDGVVMQIFAALDDEAEAISPRWVWGTTMPCEFYELAPMFYNAVANELRGLCSDASAEANAESGQQ